MVIYAGYKNKNKVGYAEICNTIKKANKNIGNTTTLYKK